MSAAARRFMEYVTGVHGSTVRRPVAGEVRMTHPIELSDKPKPPPPCVDPAINEVFEDKKNLLEYMG